MTTATHNPSSAPRSDGSGARTSAGPGAVSTITRQMAQELVPQLTSRLLDAATNRALSTVDGLTGRLETVAAEGGAVGAGGLKAVLTGKSADTAGVGEKDLDGEESGDKPSILNKVGSGLNFVVQRTIALLELVKQWIIRTLAAAKQWLGQASGATTDGAAATDDAVATEDDTDADQNEDGEDLDDDLAPDESGPRGSRSR